MPGVIDRLRDDLAAHPLMRSLPESAQEELLRASSIIHLDPGEALYRAGHAATHLFVGLRGALQIEYPTPGEDRGYVAAMLRAPWFLGECQVLHGRPWSGTAIALSPLTALALTREELEALVREQSQFALAIYREVTLRFLRAIDAWKVKPTRTPSQELARYILGYLEVVRIDDPEADTVRVRQADLGRATGLRRETVNRLLKQWIEGGLLEVGQGRLSRIDAEGLRRELHGTDAESILQTIDGVLD
jgi:CRP-like cAMP-binding protein